MGAARHHDVVGVGVDRLQRHDLGDLLTHERLALARSVLHRLDAAFAHESLHRLPQRLAGEIGDVRHAAGQ